jgi:hypothetical protein
MNDRLESQREQARAQSALDLEGYKSEDVQDRPMDPRLLTEQTAGIENNVAAAFSKPGTDPRTAADNFNQTLGPRADFVVNASRLAVAYNPQYSNDTAARAIQIMTVPTDTDKNAPLPFRVAPKPDRHGIVAVHLATGGTLRLPVDTVSDLLSTRETLRQKEEQRLANEDAQTAQQQADAARLKTLTSGNKPADWSGVNSPGSSRARGKIPFWQQGGLSGLPTDPAIPMR